MMKEIDFTVNGQNVRAKYEERDIETVFKPLLERWVNLYKEKNKRLIIAIAACPGSGKSTLVLYLEHLFSTMDFDCTLQSVGMDGFHYPNAYLQKQNLIQEKGSRNTFDVEKLKNKIIETKQQDCFWPTYSRQIHDVLENQIYVNSDIILLEGNYLLLEEEPWNQLHALYDDSIFLHVPIEELKPRLIQRKIRGGYSIEEATQFYEQSDQINVEYVLDHRIQENILINMVNTRVSQVIERKKEWK